MNRSDYIHMREVFNALAAACKQALELEAAHEWEGGTKAKWETRDGVTVAATTSQPTVAVVDEVTFMKWLAQEHPSEVVMKPVVRNAAWLTQMREEWTRRVLAGETDAPPGTQLDEGGRYLNISTTGASSIRRQLDTLAASLLASGLELSQDELSGLWASAVRMAKRRGVDTPVNHALTCIA